jgi:hypothetical protein
MINAVTHFNIRVLGESLATGRPVKRDVVRSLVCCMEAADQAACVAAGLAHGSTWGDVARAALRQGGRSSLRGGPWPIKAVTSGWRNQSNLAQGGYDLASSGLRTDGA